MKLIQTITAIFFLLTSLQLSGRSSLTSTLKDKLTEAIGNDKIGVAVITSEGDTVTVNGTEHYPLMSVMKFHQAVALGKNIGYPAIMTDTVMVRRSDLRTGTWSPMRARNSEGGEISLTALLGYSLLLSDNNACDIVFDRYMSPVQTDSILRSNYPVRDFAILYNEASMNEQPELCMDNYTTPLDCARLFDYVFNCDTTAASIVVKAILSEGTRTGTGRLSAAIPEGKGTIYHKTGTGYGAVNDAGVICYPLPDGNIGAYTIAVFTQNLPGSTEDAEKRIAEISSIVWQEHVINGLTAAANRTTVPTYTPRRAVEPEAPNFAAQVLGAIIEAAVDEIIDNAIDSALGVRN